MKAKIKIIESQIIEQFSCPYCGDRVDKDNGACCGEAGHGEMMYATDDDSSWMTHDEFYDKYEVEGESNYFNEQEPERTDDR